MASQTCNEMMLELNARQLWETIQARVNRVKQACRLRSDGDTLYRNFRLFLIEHGVTCPRFQYHVKLSRVRFPSRRRQ